MCSASELHSLDYGNLEALHCAQTLVAGMAWIALADRRPAAAITLVLEATGSRLEPATPVLVQNRAGCE